MKHISELQPGDEIIGYMRLGLALETKRSPKGVTYRAVPKKTRRASAGALTRFSGTVITNDAQSKVIRVSTTRVDSHTIPMNVDVQPADIHYSSLQRVDLLSKIHFEPTEQYVGRPTKRQGLGEKRKAYRTREQIDLS